MKTGIIVIYTKIMLELCVENETPCKGHTISKARIKALFKLHKENKIQRQRAEIALLLANCKLVSRSIFRGSKMQSCCFV